MWDDQQSVFGLVVSMKNFENGTQYHTNYNPISPFKLFKIPKDERKAHNNFAGMTPGFLIESKWNQPVPEHATCTKIGGKKALVVQTKLLAWRIDFVIDPKTYLPLQVTAHGSDGKPTTTFLSNYTAVNGIMMPSRIGFGGSPYSCTYQINVDYDESIFQTVPPEERGPDAWKKR